MDLTKRCSTCKKELEVSAFASSRCEKDGLQKTCRACRSAYIKTDVFKASQKKWRQSVHGKWKYYRKNARRRNVSFNLTFEEFSSFWQQPCTYCGNKIDTIGIDRISSNKGYQLDNCTACCTVCNWMKMDLEQDEFINHINQIINFYS